MHHEIARRKSKNSWPPGVPMKKLAKRASQTEIAQYLQGFPTNIFQLIMERLSASLSLKPVVGNWCFKMFQMVSHALCCFLQWGDTFDDHPRCIILTIRLKQCQTMDLDRLRRIIYSCSKAQSKASLFGDHCHCIYAAQRRHASNIKAQSGAILQSARHPACWIVSSSPIYIYIYAYIYIIYTYANPNSHQHPATTNVQHCCTASTPAKP